MFYNNTVKISKNFEQEELADSLSPSYLLYKFLHNLHSFLLREKVKIFDCFFFFFKKKKTMTRKKHFVHR